MERRPAPRLTTRTTAAFFGLVIAASTVSLVIPVFRFEAGLREGDVASRTFTAVHSASFESPTLTDAAREDQAQAVEEVALPVDTALRDSQKIGRASCRERVLRLV